ncbi:MAG TPA: sigma-70 family RNA polymerase sigma factor [Phycisphaerales bacterium]|nr:sigma-70 family RNA polymerase sigma factor [Phycisphaerales bacterium]
MPPPAPAALNLNERGDATRDLTAAISRGEAAAFARFYEAWFDRALAAARSLTGRDESFCLDVVQDAMLRVASRMPTLPDERSLERWLARVVRSAALDQLRREKRRLLRERSRSPATSPARPDELTELIERIDRLRITLTELPADDRALLDARFGRARTLRDAGEEAAISGDAAHGRLRRIINRLRHAATEKPR